MKRDWLKELNELDNRYKYFRKYETLWRTHNIGNHSFTNKHTEEKAKERLNKLRTLAGRDVADAKLWIQKNLSEPQQFQLLRVLQRNPLCFIEEIMQYKLTEIADICKKAFGIAPGGDEDDKEGETKGENQE